MTAPTIAPGKPLSVANAIKFFAPEQGGIEFQTDKPGKVHAWHSHSIKETLIVLDGHMTLCLLYTSPSPRDRQKSRMPSSA